MDFSLYLKESFTGSFSSILTLAKIIIPLMMVMEILKDSKILDKISKKLNYLFKSLNISDEATFPLLIGLIFGLSYGAGIIIESTKENNLSKKDLYILMIFLIVCHAIIEDTLLFVVIGANLWLLLGIRLGTAIIISLIASKILYRETGKINARIKNQSKV